MRRLYETLDRKKRAQEKRQAALECERAGYPAIARINWEEAALLDSWTEADEE